MIKTLVFSALLFLPSAAIACGCNPVKVIDDLPPESIAFIGEAISHKIVPGGETTWDKDGTPHFKSGGELVTFKVLLALRGETEGHIDIWVNGNTSCDLQRFTFKQGDKYVLSVLPPQREGNPNPPRWYWNSFCDIRHRI